MNIPNVSNLSASAKSANAQVTLSAPTESNTTISIDQHQHTAFLVEDMLKVQANYKPQGIVASVSNHCRKQREFGESLNRFCDMATPSRTPQGDGVETMYSVSRRDNDIVRSYVKA